MGGGGGHNYVNYEETRYQSLLKITGSYWYFLGILAR
jgi:hypothetical protein